MGPQIEGWKIQGTPFLGKSKQVTTVEGAAVWSAHVHIITLVCASANLVQNWSLWHVKATEVSHNSLMVFSSSPINSGKCY